jgi:hypothetical protein
MTTWFLIHNYHKNKVELGSIFILATEKEQSNEQAHVLGLP